MEGGGEGQLRGGDFTSVASGSAVIPPESGEASLPSFSFDDGEISQYQDIPATVGDLYSLTSNHTVKRRGAVSFATDTTIISDSGPRRMSSPNLSPVKEGPHLPNVPVELGCVGLKNLGNTCYMNSGLQCLMHEPSCFNFFADSKNTLSGSGSRGFNEKALTLEFNDLFRQYWGSITNEIAPEKFKDRLGKTYTQFEGYYQHDGQEFLALVLDRLHEEIVDSKKPEQTDPNDQTIPRAVSNDGSSDSAFLSAGSDSTHQNSPFSDGCSDSKSRKRQSSGSSQADSPPNPASPISGAVNQAFNQVFISESPKTPQITGQPAKRPRLTSECTIVSDDPDKLWEKYMAENSSLVSRTFQGQFASELCCKTCNHRSTTYEPFMYLTIPVPNPPKQTLTIKYADHCQAIFIKVAVQVERTGVIKVITDEAINTLKGENITVEDSAELWELHNGQIQRRINKNDGMFMLPNRYDAEMCMMHPVDLRNEQEVPIEPKFCCAICIDEFPAEGILTHSCNVFVCDSCAESTVVPKKCMKCHVEIVSYSRPAEGSNETPSAAYEEQVSVVSIRQKTYSGEVVSISVPFTIRVSKSMNSSRLYQYVKHYMSQLTDSFDQYEILYTTITGEICSKCAYGTCKGCLVPEDFDINLRSNDHFTIICDKQIDCIKWDNGESFNELMDRSKKSSLSKCLRSFIYPEDLEDDSVYCQKCQKNTCATKTMSVQRWPDTLIIYLKRFVFENVTAQKIETEVLFDRVGLKLDDLASVGGEKPDKYNLVGSIQHFGGIHAGHYTAYAKDPFDGKWNYFNDNDISRKRPSERDAQSIYILFYRRENADPSRKPLLDDIVSNRPLNLIGSPTKMTIEEHSDDIFPQDSKITTESQVLPSDLRVALDNYQNDVATVPNRPAGFSSPVRSPPQDRAGSLSVNNSSPGSVQEDLDPDLDYEVAPLSQTDVPEVEDADNCL